ncbi:hypothetical protein [Clostridium sp. M14]|uniref:hypothetical protein n=1 Tax=Clostridium sp. M14 TaxID=2716311 RepID=UPI0013EEB84B|nr:hypothetical protein [Clostridium sp. M14]MBZ9693309.1 hypothetical protein [Clostridium sp. M14]
MRELTLKQEIKRLYKLHKEGRLNENDIDDVVDRFKSITSRKDIVDEFIALDLLNIPKEKACDTCGESKPYGEIAMGEGTCAEYINRESNKSKELKVIMTRE